MGYRPPYTRPALLLGLLGLLACRDAAPEAAPDVPTALDTAPTPDVAPTHDATPTPDIAPTVDTHIPTQPDTAPEPTTLTPLAGAPPGLDVWAAGPWLVVLDHTKRPRLVVLHDRIPFAELTLSGDGPGRARPSARHKPDRAHCAEPRVTAGRIDALELALSLACADRTNRTHTFDLTTLPPSRLVAGVALPQTAPVGAQGFPALSPDAIHVALVEHRPDGELHLGVRRVDDGRNVYDEALLTAAEARPRKQEDDDRHLRRLATTTVSRIARTQRTLTRVGFTPMTRIDTPAVVDLEQPACSPRRARALLRGAIPTFAGCVPGGCAGRALVLDAWRGGEPDADLGVEALRVDGGPAGCGPGERWALRAITR